MTIIDVQCVRRAQAILFVPGHRPELFAKAAASGADAILLDLEDGVGPESKTVARENVRRWKADGGTGLVRVNAADTVWFEDDVAALHDRPTVVVLPKATAASQVTHLLTRLPLGSAIVPTIETAAGVLDVRAICSAPGVARAAFGSGDLARELGIDHAYRPAFAFARAVVVLASAACGLVPPLDGVTAAFSDEHALIRDVEDAMVLGFTGKMCIHPRQVPVVKALFKPTDDQVRWAKEIVAMAGDGSAFAANGILVDKPIVDRARQLLERAVEGGVGGL